MEYTLLIGGFAVLILVGLDILSTTLRLGGGGIISNYLLGLGWRLAYVFSKGNARSKFYKTAGIAQLVVIITMWILLMWTGFSLIYLSDPHSLAFADSKEWADNISKVYFVGYSLTTVGNGDLVALSGHWKIFTNIMGFTGLIFITISLSYLIPVVQSVIDKRVLAGLINQFGESPSEMIRVDENGKLKTLITDRLLQLNPMILTHSERHLAYPILHFFHSTEPHFNVTLNMTRMDEAITITLLDSKLEPEGRELLLKLHHSIERYMEKVAEIYHLPPKEIPPLIQMMTDNEERYKQLTKNLEHEIRERRSLVFGVLRAAGWNWQDVYGKNKADGKLS